MENISTEDLIAQVGNAPIIPAVDNAITPVEQPAPEPDISETIFDAVTGFAQASTFGFSDEISALTLLAMNGGTYDDQLARSRAQLDASAERSPVANMIGGAIGVAPAVVAGLASANPILLESGLGAVTGFGTGEGAKDSLQSGLFSSMLSFGGGAAAKGVGEIAKFPIAQRIVKRFEDSTAAKKAEFASFKKTKDAKNNSKFPEFERASQKAEDNLDRAKSVANFVEKRPLVTAAGVGLTGLPGSMALAGGLVAKSGISALDKAVPNLLPIAGARAARQGTDLAVDAANGPTPIEQQPQQNPLESVSTEELIKSTL